jgi:hypothetical protein
MAGKQPMSNSKLTRAESSRINGAKSRGPKTAAGLLRSSQNAIRHGFLADSVVLQGEDREVFQQTLDYHIEKFQPKDGVEQDLIDEMVAAGWRMRRLWWIETELFNKATKAATDPTVSSRVASAFSNLAEGNQLHLLDRYESRLHKMYQRAFKTLLETRKSEEFPPLPNEPEPDPTEELPPEPNEPETIPTAEIPHEPNEPETKDSAPSADPLCPLRETQPPQPPNEPEIPEDCYPSFTFDAHGKIIGKTYIRVSKIPNGELP